MDTNSGTEQGKTKRRFPKAPDSALQKNKLPNAEGYQYSRLSSKPPRKATSPQNLSAALSPESPEFSRPPILPPQIASPTASPIDPDHNKIMQALADSRNEKRQKVLPDPQKKQEVPPTQPYRRNQTELGSDAPVITKFIEKLSKEGASPAQVPILYSPTTGLIHFNLPHGMQPCRSQQSHQNLGTACIGASQGDTGHVQLPVEAEEETRQYRVPANRDSTGHMSTYELRSPTSTLAANVATTPPGSLHSSQQVNEEASRKRELRLIKNREAARECRRKKKEYVKCLENRVAMLENQNKMLIEELRTLQNMEAAKECRRRKKEYLECLEWRLNQLEVQNKELMDEVQFLRGILAGKSS